MPVLDFLSRIISDLLRFSIGNFSGLMVVSEPRGGRGKSGSGVEFEEHLIKNFLVGELIICNNEFTGVWVELG